ncbi:Uncharacterized protein FWK35_00004326 [Aphis craccivora]|uniref:Uncharacterized protein n=1 Tax=Aphis craccivora TaxID=307492 RepID=A0A6G0ZAW3_APHCR|nr:Uncharacterized protein FWK35_00004326 [Aphis craccivora]
MSLRKNTFFAKSHLPLLDICGFVNLWVMSCSFPVLQLQLRLTNQTIVDWASFGGESKFGKREHRVEGQWVFGCYKRETGNCFMVSVENRTADTLLKIIKDLMNLVLL